MLSILAIAARNRAIIVLCFLTSLTMISTANAQFFTRVSNAASSDGTFSAGCSWGDYP